MVSNDTEGTSLEPTNMEQYRVNSTDDDSGIRLPSDYESDESGIRLPSDYEE